MKKKVLALLLAAALVVSAFAGCSNGGNSSTSEGDTSGSSTTESGDTGDTGDTSGEAVALTAVLIRSSTDGEFPYPIITQLQEEAGVTIDWQVESQADWPTHKSVLLASGEIPDIFFGTDLEDGEVDDGLFIDWNSNGYLDMAPNIKEFLDSTPDAKSMATTASGQMYGIPNMIAFRPESGDTLYVNKTWCDQLGIDIPTTTDEFYDMLIRFRDEDPNGNGQKDEIGITGVGAPPSDPTLGAGTLAWAFPAFGVVMNESDTYCMVVDGAPQFQPVTDNYRAAVEWLNKLWSENLIDHEYFSLDFATQAAKFRGETLIMGTGSGWTMSNNVGDNIEHYELIAPLTGPNGDQYWNSSAWFYKLYPNRLCISTKCENIEKAIEFVNLCYDQYNGFQLTYGSEGVSVEKDADGNPAFLDVPEGYTDPEYKFLTGLDTYAPTWASADFVATIGGENDAKEKYNNDVYYSEWFLPESRMPYIVYDSVTMDELTILKTDINGYVQQSVADFIMNGVTDDKWNAYKDQLNKMGLERLVEIYTEGYNSTQG